MTKPRALDLFCKAGGASMGLHQAGFDVTGVDIEAQPRYPFRFVKADALEVDLSGYDLIWASPPCQAHTPLRWMYNAKAHIDVIAATRERLQHEGTPYIIENVPGAPLREPITLCGTMFGLGVDSAELRRHRIFETTSPVLLTPICNHRQKDRVIGVYGGHGRDRRRTANAQDFSVEDRRIAMGIDWMTGSELSQAVPPAYARWLGDQALRVLQLRKEQVA
jgi:DNA (cytosine-5)-methyltransferase 1